MTMEQLVEAWTREAVNEKREIERLRAALVFYAKATDQERAEDHGYNAIATLSPPRPLSPKDSKDD